MPAPQLSQGGRPPFAGTLHVAVVVKGEVTPRRYAAPGTGSVHDARAPGRRGSGGRSAPARPGAGRTVDPPAGVRVIGARSEMSYGRPARRTDRPRSPSRCKVR